MRWLYVQRRDKLSDDHGDLEHNRLVRSGVIEGQSHCGSLTEGLEALPQQIMRFLQSDRLNVSYYSGATYKA